MPLPKRYNFNRISYNENVLVMLLLLDCFFPSSHFIVNSVEFSRVYINLEQLFAMLKTHEPWQTTERARILFFFAAFLQNWWFSSNDRNDYNRTSLNNSNINSLWPKIPYVHTRAHTHNLPINLMLERKWNIECQSKMKRSKRERTKRKKNMAMISIPTKRPLFNASVRLLLLHEETPFQRFCCFSLFFFVVVDRQAFSHIQYGNLCKIIIIRERESRQVQLFLTAISAVKWCFMLWMFEFLRIETAYTRNSIGTSIKSFHWACSQDSRYGCLFFCCFFFQYCTIGISRCYCTALKFDIQ